MKEKSRSVKSADCRNESGDPPKPEGSIREGLMQAALNLFTHRGYAATTVRELVAAAGVTKPVLYYYFGSKEGLFLALMRTHFASLESVVARRRRGQGAVRNHLMALLMDGFDHVREDLDFIRLMHAAYFGPPGESPYFDFDAYHQRYHDLITQLLEEGIAGGEFRPGNAGDMAWIVLGTIEMAIEDQLCKQVSRIDRETFQRLLALVFDGLAAERGKEKAS
ncbi:MAG: TetR/AcrR family transcriptional regulator [Deltaproteobacteria bacterium]|nr:TetR/AcrR family transcriptional regulator [Deltaproteobacteria bacterium]